MNKIFLLAAFLFFHSWDIYAQSYNGPESVEYDYTNRQWFIGNSDNGTVLIWKDGILTNFVGGMSSGPYGIELHNGVLYCCYGGNKIRGYDITNGQIVANITTTAQFLNGITHNDSSLFATDFSGKKIFKIDIASGSATIIASGLAQSPNGIWYDGANNRCVFVTWGSNASIRAIDLSTNIVSLLKSTSYANIDGIARDGQGRWYISPWSNNSIVQYDSAFSSAGTVVATALSSPADIYYNTLGDTLAVPNSGNANNVVFIPFVANAVLEVDKGNSAIWYNAASNTIVYSSDDLTGQITITVYDVQGKVVYNNVVLGANHTIDAQQLPPGNYTVMVQSPKYTTTEKILIAR